MRDNKLWVIAGLSVFLLIGGGILFIGIRNVSRAIASRHWPKTPGIVVQSSGSSEQTRDFDRRSSSTMYSADIRFRYQVNGGEYTTRTLHFGQTEGSGNSADAALREFRYPVGAPVTIAYDPKDPSIAAVEPGYDSEVWLLPGAGLAFLSRRHGDHALPGRGRRDVTVCRRLGDFRRYFRYGRPCVSVDRQYEPLARPRKRDLAEDTGVIVYGQIDSSVHYTETHDGEFLKSNTSGAHLVFRYEVDGKMHYSNVRVFGELAADSGDTASRVSRQYPLGSPVTVSYSPESPDLATLEPGIASEAWCFPALARRFCAPGWP